jgi:glutathione gamma-glutamylcysteinyltransferase
MSDHGFYRRPLPPTLVPFASPEGRTLFREALAEGNLEGWFALAEQFHTQADPAFCGLGTLVVALNALGVDPGRLWKGPWRWYSEELLDCCLPLESVRTQGITLDQFACLARCNGVRADAKRAEESSIEAFRADLRSAATSASGPALAVSYSRRALGQTGDGHFSPVAGLHAGRDLALVLDVARFKYPPHWVPVPMLWEAMLPSDPATGRSRGWALLRRRATGSSVLFHLSSATLPWTEVSRRLRVELPSALAAAAPRGADELVRAFVAWMRSEILGLMEPLPASLDALAPEHRAQAEALLDALRSTALFAAVARAPIPPEAGPMTMMLLALPEETFASLPDEAREGIRALRRLDALPALLRSEVEVLREQIVALEAASAPPAATADGPGQCCVRGAQTPLGA